jgi:SsrA-binding protein
VSGKKEKQTEAPRQILNRRARFDYAIEDTYEAGIVLIGSEVKSILEGRAHLPDSYCRVANGELFLINMDIEPFEGAGAFGHERRRDRKLLLHRAQINIIERRAQEKGFTLLALKAYFKNGKVKIEVGLGRGKSQYDKRAKIAADDARREVERARSGNF